MSKSAIVASQDGRIVKYQQGKLYFYSGVILLMIVSQNTAALLAANQFVKTGVINYQGVIYG